jgi:hypothetical protein
MLCTGKMLLSPKGPKVVICCHVPEVWSASAGPILMHSPSRARARTLSDCILALPDSLRKSMKNASRDTSHIVPLVSPLALNLHGTTRIGTFYEEEERSV